MALKNTLDKLEDVDERYRSFYTEKDGKFALDPALRADADPDIDKLAEFRENNKALYDANAVKDKEIADLKASAAQTAEEQHKAAAAARKTDSERIADLEKANASAQEAAEKSAQEAERTKLRSLIQSTGAAQGVEKTALEDFADIMVDRFSAGEGGNYTLSLGGDTVMSPEKAGKVADVAEAVGVYLGTDAGRHWLAPSGGDGAGGDGGAGGGVRTISREEAETNWSNYEKDIAAGKVVVK